MEFTVTNQGVPLGRVDLTPAGLVVAELAPLPGYASVRGTIREASGFLWRMGLLADRPQPGASLDPAALERAASLPLELRDASGSFVAADYINILERPEPADPPLLVARFDHATVLEPSPRTMPPAQGDGRIDRSDP